MAFKTILTAEEWTGYMAEGSEGVPERLECRVVGRTKGQTAGCGGPDKEINRLWGRKYEKSAFFMDERPILCFISMKSPVFEDIVTV